MVEDNRGVGDGGNEYSEGHTLGGLWRDLVDMKLEKSRFFGIKFGQKEVDELPQIALLANETLLGEMGFTIKMDPAYRIKAEDDMILDVPLSDADYYCALAGGVHDINFHARGNNSLVG